MGTDYFSDREVGPPPRTSEDIPETVWGGIVAHVTSLLGNGAFGGDFPDECHDGGAVVGNNERTFSLAVRAEIPDIPWPLTRGPMPPKFAILDFVEFCHRHVAAPQRGLYHSFFRHHHLSFDRQAGQEDFRATVNRLFARNGIAFEVGDDGRVVRFGGPVLREELLSATFESGDDELDKLLESARKKFLDPDPQVRREGLEKLVDAWERLKTIEPGANKRASVAVILDKAAPELRFREFLESEAREITKIGNTFQIRHTETTQVAIQRDEQVDYLFHRLFSLIMLLLKSR